MEIIKTIYVHLSPEQLPFAKELTLSNYVFDKVPDYTHISIEQTKKITNTDCVLLSDSNLQPYYKDLQEFFELCKTKFPSFSKDPFWLLTLLRLYVVYLYTVQHDIDRFVHLENDNLIFKDYKCLESLPSGCYFTKVGPYCGSAGLIYCNSAEHFRNAINGIKQLIGKGEETIKQHTSYDFLSEMIMIDLLVRGNRAQYLPLIPTDNFFDLTKCVFDGASYGQYIGGTNNNHGPGWFGLNHYIGQLLSQNQIQILFEDKIPYILYNNTKTEIFNLHIHSKKLQNYV
jgi:hypothetical protein